MRLKEDFFVSGAVELAQELLGKLLCRRMPDKTVTKRRVTETEAYLGEEDTACHARMGKTKRNAVMYEKGGLAYVYLCYGIHEMLNVVSGQSKSPEAVLIRGVEGADGPGKLTKALEIDRSLNGTDLTVSDELWFEDDGQRPKYEAFKRIGIDYADERDKARLWRFKVKETEQ